MITEDYVSFETAKLLKEKGFNEKCAATYNLDISTFEVEIDTSYENCAEAAIKYYLENLINDKIKL